MATAPLPEPTGNREETAAHVEVERERQRRRWAEEGYEPRAHLRQTTGEGEPQVLSRFYELEWEAAQNARPRVFAARLACKDLEDIARMVRGFRRSSEAA